MFDVIIEPWKHFILRTVVPKHLVDKMIELTDDILSKSKKRVSASDHLVGEMEKEYYIGQNNEEIISNVDKDFIDFLNSKIDDYFDIQKERAVIAETTIVDGDYSIPKKFENTKIPISYMQMWFNEMTDGEYNPIHAHQGVISAVFILKIPEYLPSRKKNVDGALFFVGKPLEGGIELGHRDIKILPLVGDLFIFPASLRHMVYPFRTPDGKGVRRSISFNVDIDFPDDRRVKKEEFEV